MRHRRHGELFQFICARCGQCVIVEPLGFSRRKLEERCAGITRISIRPRNRPIRRGSAGGASSASAGAGDAATALRRSRCSASGAARCCPFRGAERATRAKQEQQLRAPHGSPDCRRTNIFRGSLIREPAVVLAASLALRRMPHPSQHQHRAKFTGSCGSRILRYAPSPVCSMSSGLSPHSR